MLQGHNDFLLVWEYSSFNYYTCILSLNNNTVQYVIGRGVHHKTHAHTHTRTKSFVFNSLVFGEICQMVLGKMWSGRTKTQNILILPGFSQKQSGGYL